MSEAANLKRVMIKSSRLGMRLLRNNRGAFYTMDGVKHVMTAIFSGNIQKAKTALGRLRVVRAGLEAEGASDLVGVTTVTITPEMVGMKLGVATVAEVKEPKWKKPTDEHERKQENFLDQATKRGCIAFFITDAETLEKKVEESLKKLVDAHLKNV